MVYMKRFAGILLPLVLAALLSACWSSNTAVYTGPPARTTPLEADTTGAGPYHLSDVPDSLSVDFVVPGDTACPVRIEFRNAGTKLVRVLADSIYAPGKYNITWDRTDSSGVLISFGFYYYKFYICDKTSTLKVDYRRHWE
jgi:hypothetical protein